MGKMILCFFKGPGQSQNNCHMKTAGSFWDFLVKIYPLFYYYQGKDSNYKLNGMLEMSEKDSMHISLICLSYIISCAIFTSYQWHRVIIQGMVKKTWSMCCTVRAMDSWCTLSISTGPELTGQGEHGPPVKWESGLWGWGEDVMVPCVFIHLLSTHFWP